MHVCASSLLTNPPLQGHRAQRCIVNQATPYASLQKKLTQRVDHHASYIDAQVIVQRTTEPYVSHITIERVFAEGEEDLLEPTDEPG